MAARGAMATAVAASNDVMDEYDPDDDPLFGRLVSLRVDEPGHSWRDGIVAHVHTEVVDGIERATGVYMVVWGKFDRTEDVMRIPAKEREVRALQTAHARPANPNLPRIATPEPLQFSRRQ